MEGRRVVDGGREKDRKGQFQKAWYRIKRAW